MTKIWKKYKFILSLFLRTNNSIFGQTVLRQNYLLAVFLLHFGMTINLS